MPKRHAKSLLPNKANITKTNQASKGTFETISRISSYAIRALIIVAIIIGSSLLCTVSPVGSIPVLIYILRGVGMVGFVVALFFGQRLIRNMKNKK